MSLKERRALWRAGLAAGALCVALLAATAATAIPLPSPGPYTGLPAGWILQVTRASDLGVTSISFPNTTDGWALLGGSEQKALLKTTDGGKNWTDITPVGLNLYISAISFADAHTGWAVGMDDTIYKSTDAGSSWTTATTPAVTTLLYAVQAVDPEHVTAVGNPTFVVSTSDGTNWSQAPVDGDALIADGELFALHMVSATQGWACGEDGSGDGMVLSRASNGHWVRQTTASPQRSFESIWFTDVSHGWAVSDTGQEVGADMFATENGGATWSLRASNVTTQSPRAIAFLNNNHGFIGCDPRGTLTGNQVLLETTDGGAHWTGFDPNPPGFDQSGAAIVRSFSVPDAYHIWAGGGFGLEDPPAVWALQTAAPKQLLGAPVIVPQFSSKPFTVEDHDWLHVNGSLSTRHKTGTYSVNIVEEKRVGKKWKVKRSFKAKTSRSGWTYSAKIIFSSSGNWRIRAVHGRGKSSVASGYTYYGVIRDGWDNP
ncbi:MAG: YCF48-related protein [Coriobacteriia bacterium]|nr:YCF48-related protein [Coriobacteriia bacterium]